MALPVFATTTVTGTIQNLGTGNITSNAFVRFWLRGCAGNQPRINGTAIIGPSQGGVFFFDFPTNSSGVISGTLYSTRDATGLLGGDIECGGSKTAVWYGMQTFVNGKGGPEVPVHALSGGTLDVTQVTPITTNPVITPPSGDSTYFRLDAGNSPITGNTQFNGTVTTQSTGTHNGADNFNGTSTFNGPLNETATNTGNVAGKNFAAENVRYVSTSGNDSNDGRSWGTAKLTPQAAMNAASNSGVNPGATVYLACGVYPAPTTWYSATNYISMCLAPMGGLCGTYLCGPNQGSGNPTTAVVVFQLSASLIIGSPTTQPLNIGLRGIVFDGQNAGWALTLQNVSSFVWDDVGLYRCGDTTTPCLTMNTGTASLNNSFNTYRNLNINPRSDTVAHYANCLLLQGSTGGSVTDNEFYNVNCQGQINNGIDLEQKTDSNYFYGVKFFETLGAPPAGNSQIEVNTGTPASDQDAGNGCQIYGLNSTGTFGFQLSLGQTTGLYVTTSNAIVVHVLGGTPLYTLLATSLTAGVHPQSTMTGFTISDRYSLQSAPALTTGAFAFSAGWGTLPSFTTVRGSDGNYFLTFAAGSGSPTANPSITVTYTEGAWNVAPICHATDGADTTASPSTAQPFAVSNASTSTVQTLVFLGTPTASHSYQVAVKCDGSPN